jgi:hypothetical protein
MHWDAVITKLHRCKLIFSCSCISLLSLGFTTPELYSMTCPATTQVSQADSAANSPDKNIQSNAIVIDRRSGARWATVLDCNHPGWPARMVLLPASSSPLTAEGREVAVAFRPHSFVRVGERVKLWSSDDLLRIEVDGVAEETKEEGQRIRVRLTQHMGSYGQSPERQLMGVVRGRGDVELVR